MAAASLAHFALKLAMIKAWCSMKFMNEKSLACGSSLETCPAKQMLTEAIDLKATLSPFPNHDQAQQPQLHHEDEQRLNVGRKIIRESDVNCFGDECWAVNGLIKALFSKN